MKIALVEVPDDTWEAVGACLDKAKTDASAKPKPPRPAVGWDPDHAAAAVRAIGDAETRLLWRIADARGARVPLGELARDLGLPGTAALDRDFPGMSRYCGAEGESRPPLPVLAGGADDGAWYWMDPALGAVFRGALEDQVFCEPSD